MYPHPRRKFSSQYQVIAEDVHTGSNCRIGSFVNLYGCKIGSNTTIGSFVEIQSEVIIGSNCKIGSHTFVCSGVEIEDEVFIGHNVSFINDRYPRAVNELGQPQEPQDWKLELTRVCHGASIGTSSTIMCGVTIGANATVGAGSIVTHDVSPGTTVIGVQASPHNTGN